MHTTRLLKRVCLPINVVIVLMYSYVVLFVHRCLFVMSLSMSYCCCCCCCCCMFLFFCFKTIYMYLFIFLYIYAYLCLKYAYLCINMHTYTYLCIKPRRSAAVAIATAAVHKGNHFLKIVILWNLCFVNIWYFKTKRALHLFLYLKHSYGFLKQSFTIPNPSWRSAPSYK